MTKNKDKLTVSKMEKVAQRNSQDLTEKWNGEIKDYWYYYTESGIEQAHYCEVNGIKELVMPDIDEVLAPVPSYAEYMILVSYKEELTKACKMRDKIIKKYQDIDTWWKDENQKLKELLKECRDIVNENLEFSKSIGRNRIQPRNKGLLKRIDEVLK